MHNRALFEILIHLKLVWLLITHPKDQSDYYPLIPKKKNLAIATKYQINRKIKRMTK